MRCPAEEMPEAALELEYAVEAFLAQLRIFSSE